MSGLWSVELLLMGVGLMGVGVRGEVTTEMFSILLCLFNVFLSARLQNSDSLC